MTPPNQRGLSFLEALLLLFIGLKLTGYITWSWLAVFMPVWIWMGVFIVMFVGALIASSRRSFKQRLANRTSGK